MKARKIAAVGLAAAALGSIITGACPYYASAADDSEIDHLIGGVEVTDITAQLKSAVRSGDATGDGMNIISIDKGTYELSEDVVLPSSCRISGSGSETVIRFVNNEAKLRTRKTDASSDIGLYSLVIDGNGFGDNAVEISGAKDVILSDCEIKNTVKSAVALYGGSKAKLLTVNVDTCEGNGIVAYEDSYLEMSSCGISSCDGNGVNISSSAAKLSSVSADKSGKNGIAFYAGSKGTISGGKVSCCGNNGIVVYEGSSLDMTGGTVSSCDGNGFTVSESSARLVSVTANYNKGNGISVYEGTLGSKSSNANYNTGCGFYIGQGSAAEVNGGSAKGNGSHGLHSAFADVNISSFTASVNKVSGIFLSGKQTSSITGSSSYNNSETGIVANKETTLTLRSSKIYKNKCYGVYVINASVLYANDSAKNEIYANNYTGVSIVGNNSKGFLHGNKMTRNGQQPRETEDGLGGHGITVAEFAYANITSNNISNNSQCGISVFDGASAKINKNTLSGNGRHGVGARRNVKISEMKNNKITSNGYNGVMLSENSTGTLTDNTISESANLGISVINSKATLKGNTVSASKGNNINITNNTASNRSTVEMKDGNIIKNGVLHGISVAEGSALKITGKNNKIEGNKKNGILVNGTNSKYKSSLVISGSTSVSSNGECGIYGKGQSTISAKNLNVSSNKKYGVGVVASADLNLWSSKIQNNKSYGICISGTTGKVTKSTISGNSKAGIAVTEKSKVSKIENNTIKNHSESGIMAKGSSTVSLIKNNTITGNKKYGIVSYSSSLTSVRGNTYKNNGRNIYRT